MSRPFDNRLCPIARTSELLNDSWTALMLRELMVGRNRFGELQTSLDISKAVLTERLNKLVMHDIVDRRPYQDRPVRHEYVLTDKGLALWDVLLAMWSFGDTWLIPDDAGLELVYAASGDAVRPVVIDQGTGLPIDVTKTRLRRRAA